MIEGLPIKFSISRCFKSLANITCGRRNLTLWTNSSTTTGRHLSVAHRLSTYRICRMWVILTCRTSVMSA